MPDTGPAAAWLNGVRERADHADQVFRLGGNFGEAAARSQADVPRLLAAVEAVLERHQPVGLSWGSAKVCGRCRDSWPCGEVQAITAKLLGKERSDG
jgi:hypothetical protein